MKKIDQEMSTLFAQRGKAMKELNVIKLKSEAFLGNIMETDKYELVEITVDSGAGESVIPPELMAQFGTQPTDASRSGEEYIAASGDVIQNEGERTCDVVTLEGVSRKITFQVTGVNKALLSVGRVCEKNQAVIFTPHWSYIQCLESGEVVPLKSKNGVWVLEVWAPKTPRAVAGFTRPGGHP